MVGICLFAASFTVVIQSSRALSISSSVALVTSTWSDIVSVSSFSKVFQSALAKKNVVGEGVKMGEVEMSRIIGMWSLVVKGPEVMV